MSGRLSFGTLTLVVALVLASCSGGSSGSAPGDSTTSSLAPDDSATTERARLVLEPDQVGHDVGITFQSGRFLITIGTVVHDRGDDMLHLGLRVQNLSESWAAPSADGVLLVDGRELHVRLGSSPRIPPGHSSDLTAEVLVAGADPIADGVLRWGRDDETQTTVALADGHAEGFGPPIDLPIDAWGQIGRHTVHLVGGRLYADSVRPQRAEPGQHVLRIELDEYTSASSPVNGFVPADHVLLVWPDGTTVEPLGGSRGRAPQSWTATFGESVDFPIPSEVDGDYEVLLASVSRSAFGLLHPELVERVAIPISIDAPVRRPSPHDPAAGQLPVPLLSTGAPDPVDVELALDEVNVSGWAFTVTRLRWDPDTEVAHLEGTARRLEPVQPQPTGGLFSTPDQFAPTLALVSGGRLVTGLVAGGIPSVSDGDPVEVAYELPFVRTLDPDDAMVLVGLDHMAPSILPLGAEAPLSLTPAAPALERADAPEVTAGNFRVQVVGYRFGLPRPLDRPPPGRLALELVIDVTADPVEEAGPFGLRFTTRTQLFLAGSDGYLQQAENHDTVDLEPGETARLGGTFYVPATWQPGPVALTVRSLDELTAITSVQWVEVTFTADLLPGEGT